MFKKEASQDEYVIRHKPNRAILFIDQTHWIWTIIFLVGAISIYTLFGPATQNRVYSLENYLALITFLVVILLVPFYAGIKLGANLYRPHQSFLTTKHEKGIDALLANEGDISIKLIRKDGRIEVLGEEK